MRRRNRDRGFTLIELLIVVTIILIIAAFTIPKLTKSHDSGARSLGDRQHQGDQ